MNTRQCIATYIPINQFSYNFSSDQINTIASIVLSFSSNCKDLKYCPFWWSTIYQVNKKINEKLNLNHKSTHSYSTSDHEQSGSERPAVAWSSPKHNVVSDATGIWRTGDAVSASKCTEWSGFVTQKQAAVRRLILPERSLAFGLWLWGCRRKMEVDS